MDLKSWVWLILLVALSGCGEKEGKEDKAKQAVKEVITREFQYYKGAKEKIGEAGREGPIDAKTIRLIKLAIAIGAMREGAVHSSVRKALAAGIAVEALEQVVALAASTLGMPATVAVFTWVRDEVDKRGS